MYPLHLSATGDKGLTEGITINDRYAGKCHLTDYIYGCHSKVLSWEFQRLRGLLSVEYLNALLKYNYKLLWSLTDVFSLER